MDEAINIATLESEETRLRRETQRREMARRHLERREEHNNEKLANNVPVRDRAMGRRKQ